LKLSFAQNKKFLISIKIFLKTCSDGAMRAGGE
jgi:hypothetical protein